MIDTDGEFITFGDLAAFVCRECRGSSRPLASRQEPKEVLRAGEPRAARAMSKQNRTSARLRELPALGSGRR